MHLPELELELELESRRPSFVVKLLPDRVHRAQKELAVVVLNLKQKQFGRHDNVLTAKCISIQKWQKAARNLDKTDPTGDAGILDFSSGCEG